MGSLAAALGPAAFFFRRPMRVVGCGGGSYLGLSFLSPFLSLLSPGAPGGPPGPPIPDDWF